jgi:hypothetical protein
MNKQMFNIPAVRDKCCICGMPMFVKEIDFAGMTYLITMSCVVHDYIEWTYFVRVELHTVADHSKEQKAEEARLE